MRRIAIALLPLLIVSATAGMAGPTGKSKFDGLIGKYAADAADVGLDKFTPKAACVCPGRDFANWPGVLARFPGVGAVIFCQVVTFAENGSLQGFGYCPNFQLLSE